MVTNFPGPWQLAITYQVDVSPGGVLEHVMQFNVDVDPEPDIGQSFSTIYVVNAEAGSVLLSTALNGIRNVVEDLFNSGDCTFVEANLYKVTPGSFERTWYSSSTIGAAGTSASATVPAGQQTYQFRTAEGGIMKIVLLDAVGDPAPPIPYASLAANPKALVDYVLGGATTWILGRDTAFPVSFITLQSGTNEKTFRQRYRP